MKTLVGGDEVDPQDVIGLPADSILRRAKRMKEL